LNAPSLQRFTVIATLGENEEKQSGGAWIAASLRSSQ
jgi:hypothetical protein